MKKLFVILLLLGLQNSLFAAIPENEIRREPVFGNPLHWYSPDVSSAAMLEKAIKDRAANYKIQWDPDCVYRFDKKCEAPKDVTSLTKLESLSKTVSQETSGHFNANRKFRDRTARDFGGLSQGYFLEEIAREVKGPFFANFAGDIFVSEGFPTKSLELTIPDPLHPAITYARIDLQSPGWVIAEGNAGEGTELYDPKTGRPVYGGDFTRVTLFANSNFNGGRLDAWATAILVGGKPLLKKLWDDKKFKGQWAYFFIDSQGHSACSPGLVCKLLKKDERSVRVKF